MNCYIICEPENENIALSEKLKKYISGIKKQLRKSKSKLIMLSCDNLSESISYFQNKNLRPVIIVAGITFMWVREITAKLLDLSVHPIIMSPFRFPAKYNQYSDHISTVSFDEAGAINETIRYFIENNITKIAYFGFNPNINSHKIQHNTFMDMKAIYALPSIHPHHDTYVNIDYIDNCSEVFLDRAGDYEAVICSTPEYTIKLIYDLKKAGLYSKDFYIATIGSSPLTRFSSPALTTFDFDASICGEKTVMLYNLLINNSDIYKLDVKIKGTLLVNESTSFMPYSHKMLSSTLDTETLPNPEFQFVEDTELDAINKIENLLYKSDEIDIDYIASVLDKKDLKYFAENHFISENTLHYRIKNMCKCLSVSSKHEMMELLLKWLR